MTFRREINKKETKAQALNLAHIEKLMNKSKVEKRTLELGSDIFKRSHNFFGKAFQKGYFSDLMMKWSMNHPEFKVEMFRFVDVLPSLVNNDQIIKHIKEYLLQSGLNLPTFVKPGLNLATNIPWTEGLTAAAVKKNVSKMAKTFITGQDSKSAIKNLRAIWNNGQCFTVDILGEATVSKVEAIDYQKRYLELIEGIAKEAIKWKSNPILETSSLGEIPRSNVSIKCSSLYSQIDPLAFRSSVNAIKNRLRPLLQAAVRNNVFINLDMEQNDYREIVLKVAEEIFAEEEFKNYAHFGIVIQAYLKCSPEDLNRVIKYSSQRKHPLTVRLVKGAYWDFEVIQSIQKGWEIPVFTQKAESDINYEKLTKVLLDNYPKILAAFGSHNVRSLSHAMAYAEEIKLPKNAFEIQMLYGMANSFKTAVTGLGYRVREYAPIGEMLPGMAYLVRRLLENSSNESFLKVKFMKPSQATKMLSKPETKEQNDKVTQYSKPNLSRIQIETFHNEPLRDFSKAENREWIETSLQNIRKQLPFQINPVVEGKSVEGTPIFKWNNPSHLKEQITNFGMANQYHADLALTASNKALKTWGKTSPLDRAKIIRNVAEVLKKQKNDLTALIVLETGKNFKEADADIAEAIDFCNYYAAEMEILSCPRTTEENLPGEHNQYLYKPRGITVAIAPWNFPLAILTGMTVGPLVCGNPVIMKPAEQSTAIGLFLYKALIEAGVPRDAVHFLPGAGEVVGKYLVNHSDTQIITFTGSKAVGLEILQNAYQPLPGQKHIKKVVCELGGKNGLIIDDDADLDEAVTGAIYSAFAFQGQKCSALSRIFVLEPCYEAFKNRFVEAMGSLKIGPAEDVSAKVGPVIDQDSKNRILQVIENNRSKIIGQLEVPEELKNKGNYVPVTVFEENDLKSELAQKEFFGPIVTLFKVKNINEAIKAMNNVDYALTGGIYSRSPENIQKAKEELEVGNLYINRGITGAIVCRQPFGGFKLSGVGAKAGGPDYLLQFLEPVTITENTMRRGFAPEI